MKKQQNKIEKLIAEMCPDGVEFLGLGEICKIETGKLNANASCENGEFLFFTTSKKISRTDSYRWDTEALLVAGNANVGDVKHYSGKFNAYQRTYVLTSFLENVNVRYLYFVLSSSLKKYLETRSNKAAMTYIVLGTLQGFKIPIPPIEIQEKIVDILDTFTQLEAELAAELAARRKQYEHYRNQLLTFDDVENNPEGGVPWFSLGEVAEIVGGSGLPKSDFSKTGVGCIHYGQIYTFFGNHTEKVISFIPQEKADKLKKVNNGDVILAKTSENIEDVCKSVAYIGKEQIVTGGHTAILKHKQNAKFLSYYLNGSDNFQKQKRKYLTGTKVIDISLKSLNKIKIPVPPLEKQKEIVEILDKFDALVNDISTGLPAEITARRKQYEHYRNELLTFKEKETATL